VLAAFGGDSFQGIAIAEPDRRAGRKPQKLAATIDWLQRSYPNGIPPAVKNEVLLQDLAKLPAPADGGD
jgi:hypothetical protein